MPAYVRTPDVPGVPVRQVNVATYRKRVKSGMPSRVSATQLGQIVRRPRLETL